MCLQLQLANGMACFGWNKVYTLSKSLPAVLEAPKHWTWHQMIADRYLAWEAGCGT